MQNTLNCKVTGVFSVSNLFSLIFFVIQVYLSITSGGYSVMKRGQFL